MSSFKRKATSAQQLKVYPGSRISPTSTNTIITSTGIPSLDDILGGGIPLSCSVSILAPDPHSAYGELAQKYFVAQGLACGQKVCLVGEKSRTECLLKDCMWLAEQDWKYSSTAPPNEGDAVDDKDDAEDENENNPDDGGNIDIAWRYGGMKKFQTTVESISSGEYCCTFDLTRRIPNEIVQACTTSKQLIYGDIAPDGEHSSTSKALAYVTEALASNAASNTAFRICIPSLGSADWGDLSYKDILRFMHSLRFLLRRFPFACASIGLAPHLCSDVSAGWVQKLSWLSDGAISMSAFSGNPSLSLTFPSHHGLVHIHSLPSPHTLLPGSDKSSVLRGISASSSISSQGGGENNLGFKCMRKRLVFETLHLDIDGGVTERRAKPAAKTLEVGSDGDVERSYYHEENPQVEAPPPVDSPSEAQVEIKMEGTVPGSDGKEYAPKAKLKTKKKQVAFRTDRPELYDF